MALSSSQPIRGELVLVNERGIELVQGKKSFAPTAKVDGTADAERAKYLRRHLRTLNYELADVTDTRNRIQNLHHKWITAREAMTGKERVDDNPIFEEFSAAHPYLDTSKELDKYARQLQRQRDDTEDELEELVGADVTMASVHSTSPIREATPAPIHPPPNYTAVKLKPVEIPCFAGDITEFPNFREMFLAATLNMPAVPQFLHLKGHLKGSALAAIGELPTTEQSIKDAWRILNAEFGNQTALQDALYNDLQNLKGTDGRATDLRRFVDALEQTCLKLSRAGENPDQRYLTNLVERKLPYNILQEVHKAKLAYSGAHWTMTDLKQKLKDILKLRESMNRVMDQINVENPKLPSQGRSAPHHWQAPNRPPPHQGYQQGRQYRGQHDQGSNQQASPTTLTFVAQQSGQSSGGYQPRERRPCAFCKSLGHYSTRCPDYGSLKNREERLSELGLCIRCASAGHHSQQCNNARPCSGCQQDHHRLMCPEEVKYTQAASRGNRSPANTATGGNRAPLGNSRTVNIAQVTATAETPQAMDDVDPLEATTNVAFKRQGSSPQSSSKTLVFLKTIVVDAYNPKTMKSTKALVLFDDGSTDSYVANKLCEELGLSLGPPQTLTVGTFSSTRTSTHTASLTEIGLRGASGEERVIQAHAMGYITQPVQFLYANQNDLKEEFPSASLGRRQPDILIGSDWYYDFELTPTRRFPCGLSMVQSSLGVFLAGRAQINPGKQFPYNPLVDLMQEPRHVLHSIQYLPEADSTESKLDKLVEAHFNLESIGIEAPGAEKTDSEVDLDFKNSIYFDENEQRYYVRFPWKDPLPVMGSNYGNSHRRLRWLIRRLKAMGRLEDYHAVILDYFRRGFTEIVHNPALSTGLLFYLPHREVIRPDKPGKIRQSLTAQPSPPRTLNP